MDLGDPVSAVIPSLEGQVLRVLAATTRPLPTSTVVRLVHRGSEPGVRTALRRLTAVGTVLVDQVGVQHTYRANRDHAAWPAVQAAVDFADGFRARLGAEIARLTAEAARAALGTDEQVTCALFGSTARGTADAGSDVDLVLVVPDGATADAEDALSRHLADGVERFTGNPADVLVLTASRRDALVASDDALVRSWRADARTLCGPPLLPVPGHT